MFVTVCTPTYNRAYCLSDLYQSLKVQTNKNFEWIIVDDGSCDNTKGIVSDWVEHEKNFDIRYIYKENGGKHTAVNRGVQHAQGECLIIVDSDDILAPNAIEDILTAFAELPQEGFAGVGFNKLFLDGSLVGTTFSGDSVDATSLERPRYNIGGDKAEVFYTEILKKYPFPVFEGERFLTEAIVWNRIAAAGYKLRWYNKGIYLCQYREDGLSMNASGLNSFEGYTLAVKELLSYNQAILKEKICTMGVYAWVAEQKNLSTRQVACRLQIGAPLVFVAKSMYKLKRFLRPTDRRKQLNVRR